MPNKVSADGMTEKERNIIKDVDHAIQNAKTLDSFMNPSARLGLGSNNQLNNSNYVLTRFTFDYRQLTALFRNNWIVQKIIAIPAKDMVRHGIQLETEIEPKEIKKIEKKLKSVSAQLIEGLQWGRLYGGAIGVLLLDSINEKKLYFENDQYNSKSIYEMPIDYDMIGVNSFKGIFVVDRWNGVTPTGELVGDIGDPRFGYPEFFQIYLPNKQSIKVHHSWVLDFKGIEMPRLEKYADVYWGMSVIEPLYEELKKYDGTNYSLAELVFRASMRVVKFNNFATSLGTGGTEFQKQLKKRLSAMEELQSSQGILAMDKSDEFETHSTSFSNLDNVMESFKDNIAGASNIPKTKLFGKSPTGLGSEDKASTTNYYDYVSGEQERDLRDTIDKLLKVISKSELGYIPDDLEFDFKYLGDVIDKAGQRSIAKDKITEVREAYNDGIVPLDVTQKELQQIGKEYGLFTNLTDDIIAKSKKEIDEYDIGESEAEKIVKDAKRRIWGRK